MTVESSSSCSPPAAAPRGEQAPRAAHAAGTPLIDVRDLGIWYRLHRRKRSLKQMLLRGWRSRELPMLWALRHVSLACHEGECLGIVGPNGAGKSTLCLVLAGILTPDEGSVVTRGSISTLLTLGAGFNRNLSGRANVRLYAAFLGIGRRALEQKMDRIIDFSELGSFIDEPLRCYSAGMRARLAFSVAATLEPEILILDEVLGVGDAAFKMKSRQRLLQMMEGSRLIVVVSHATSFLRKVATHCLWLEQGRVRGLGEAAGVLDAYDEAMGVRGGEQPEDE